MMENPGMKLAKEKLNRVQAYLELEALFEDELKCQSSHDITEEHPFQPLGDICTVKAVALKQVCSMREFPICQESYTWNRAMISVLGYLRCDDCGKRIDECWKLTLI
jgi:hypothetical protein